MLPNTYVKIVNRGIENPIEGLANFGASERIIPLGEGRDVEVRHDKTRAGLIVIIRDTDNNTITPHYTEGSVYIQEGRETISANHSVTPFLSGLNPDGTFDNSYPSILDNPFVMPVPFEATTEGDIYPDHWLATAKLVDLFNALDEEVIHTFDHCDRIFIETTLSYPMSKLFSWLQEELNDRYGLNLTPIGKERVNYFLLEKV